MSLTSAIALGPGSPPTPQSRIVNRILRRTMRPLLGRSEGDAGMVRARRIIDTVGLATRVPRGVEVARQDFGRFGGEWVRARNADEKRPFLYLHGGGYFFGSARLYRGFSWRLSASTGRPVLLPDYRLAPEHTPADALTDALLAYESLLARGHSAGDIVVGGDSAGGHLALALVHALKRRGAPLPSAVVALSPWADLRCTGESITLNDRTEYLLYAPAIGRLGDLFCGHLSEDDPIHDPVCADYTGFPPLMIISSSSEAVRDDARLVARLASETGVEVVHQEWNDQAHVFAVLADFIPEGKAAFRHIAEFLRAR